ncbi:hypothetical protein MAIT1_04778 [Magnetofaba australis IT-1]|uniref:DUF6900 domain-containing protein n=3 Tax=Magnetofaba TaxID=1472292 RepID=A0A1Y2K5G5_9PROT|nr:hypothetical protein MAIT1_05272 [Magnetofaba australis IT-1]OSM04476.1 hypothetical protein MAIT1_04778 [Magnetofaba australis IT-1]
MDLKETIMNKMTSPQLTVLVNAALREDGAVHPLPNRMKGGAAIKIVNALAKHGVITQEDDGQWRLNAAGYAAIGETPPERLLPQTQAEEPAEPQTDSSSIAPDALFEEIASKHLDIDTLETRRLDDLDFHDCAVWAIKSALEAAYQAGMVAAKQRTPKPRENSKQATMIALMKRPEGATIEQLEAATSWNRNTLRGAISGALRKRLGLNVTSERVTDEQGKRTIYRIVED